MRDPVAEAVDVLARSGVPFVRDGASLRVAPEGPEGFEVWLGPGAAWEVAYEGWHAPFADPEQALACFLLGLTEGVRLVVTRRGGAAQAWTVELREGESWRTIGRVGRIFPPFWRRKDVVVLRNRRAIARPQSPPGEAPRSPA
jgi:hypothetical protein